MGKRVLCLLLLCALAFAGLAKGGESIRFVALNTPLIEGIKSLIPAFEKETGIKVVVEQFAEDQLSQKLAVELTAGSDLDVYLTRPLNEARLFKKNNWCTDLAPFYANDAEYDFKDFTPGSIQSTTVDGVQIAIPMMTEVQVVFYRKDILEQHGLKPPETFEDIETIAKKVTDRDKEMYGVLMRGQASPLVTQLSSYLYGFGGDWFDRATMKATFDTPEAIKAIEFYGGLLRKYGPPGAPNMSWPQMMAIYYQGKGVLYIDASSHFPILLDPKKSNMAEKTGIALFPAGPAGRKIFDITAWGLGIYSKSTKKDAAWKFIRYMSSKKSMAHIQGNYAVETSRQSAYADPEGTKMFPADWIKAVKDSAPYGVGYDRPLVTAVQEARDILGAAVVAVMEGKDATEAAKRANQRFQEILDREAKDK